MAVHFTLFTKEEIVEIGEIGELLAKIITTSAKVHISACLKPALTVKI